MRVKQGGGHVGHNGLRSIHAHIGDTHGRVRLGIGHPGRKELVSGYVLRGVSDGAGYLAVGDGGRFMNHVARRTAPPRSSTAAAKTPARAKEPPQEPDSRSALQKLAAQFR